MISVCFQGKPFNTTVIQVCAPTSNAEEAEVEQFYEDLQDLLELKPKNDVLLIIGNWNAKVGSQEIPEITGKFGLGVQNEAGQRLILSFAKRTHCKHPLLTTQQSTHGHHQMVNTEIRLIIFFAAKMEKLQSAKTRPGADCGSDQELFMPHSAPSLDFADCMELLHHWLQRV